MAQPHLFSIVEHFEDLPDPREDRNRRHKLVEIVVIAVCGVLSGCDAFTEIEQYGRKKIAWLKRFLELPNGIPSHDTFSRVFACLNPEAFQRCFFGWVLKLCEAFQGKLPKPSPRQYAIDGKTLRRSHDRGSGLGPLHLVSVWVSEQQVSLGQLAVDEKSNEITAIPELLEMLEVSGGVVTIDAMGCQKEIAAKIREKGADYVLGLKGNQGKLHQEVRSYIEEQMDNDFAEVACSRHETNEKRHGRQEHRAYYQLDVPKHWQQRGQWRGLRTIGVVISFRTLKGEEQADARYYISSLRRNAKRFASAVRGHWGIENSLHWVLDVTFDEDRSRVRKGHGAVNLAWIRRFAISLLKQHPDKRSIRSKRLASGWDNDFLLEVLTGKAT